MELDPRNFFTLQQIALSYQFLGRYADSIAAMDRALAIMPDNLTRALRGLFYLCWKADTRPPLQTIEAILAQEPSAIAGSADIWFLCALAERDPAAAERALVAEGDADALARELLQASEQPELLAAIAERGAAAVAEKFEQGAQVRFLESHYREAMAML